MAGSCVCLTRRALTAIIIEQINRVRFGWRFASRLTFLLCHLTAISSRSKFATRKNLTPNGQISIGGAVYVC